MNVRGNNGAAARNFTAHHSGLDLLAPRHKSHFLGDYTLARVMHLRNIARPIGRRRLAQSLLNPSISNSHASPSEELPPAGSLSRCRIIAPRAPTSNRRTRGIAETEAKCKTVNLFLFETEALGLGFSVLATIQPKEKAHRLNLCATKTMRTIWVYLLSKGI